MSNMEFDIREYIKTGFERIEKKLDDITNATNINNQNIALLSSKSETMEKDINSLGNNNRLQHTEFYSKFSEMKTEIDKADLPELKEDVKRHDSDLDQLKGSFKLGGWVFGALLSVLGLVIALLELR